MWRSNLRRCALTNSRCCKRQACTTRRWGSSGRRPNIWRWRTCLCDLSVAPPAQFGEIARAGEKMAYGIRLKVWGDYACFTRPEMKVERVSYDVMTPSAARGILEAIHWKPAIRWVVDAIHVLEKPRFQSIRRNEVGSKIPA